MTLFENYEPRNYALDATTASAFSDGSIAQYSKQKHACLKTKHSAVVAANHATDGSRRSWTQARHLTNQVMKIRGSFPVDPSAKEKRTNQSPMAGNKGKVKASPTNLGSRIATEAPAKTLERRREACDPDPKVKGMTTRCLLCKISHNTSECKPYHRNHSERTKWVPRVMLGES